MKKLILSLIAAAAIVVVSAAPADTLRRVRLETTMGDIVVALYNDTPLHRDNFLKLVRSGYYDGLLFHRVIRDFMIQGGDPDSRDAAAGKQLGEGGPGYTIPAEINYPTHYHKRGALAAAREGDDVNPEMRSAGSQFYIVWGKQPSEEQLAAYAQTIRDASEGDVEVPDSIMQDYRTNGGTPHLDGAYTVFGEVVEGLKVVKKIQDVRTDRYDRPKADVRIVKASVVGE